MDAKSINVSRRDGFEATSAVVPHVTIRFRDSTSNSGMDRAVGYETFFMRYMQKGSVIDTAAYVSAAEAGKASRKTHA